MLYNYVQHNFMIVINIVFLLLFLKTNTLLDKGILRKFRISMVLLIVLTIAENVELWAVSLSYPTMLRVWMSILGYSIRPLIIYCLILIVQIAEDRYRKLLPIPAILNAMVVATALFSDIAFSYDEANRFVRGPLGFSPYICSAIYFVVIILFSVHFFGEKCYAEAVIILAIVLACGCATGLEAVWKHVGLLRTTIALSITFFYLYLHAQTFKRDALTGALNRRCFYLDAERYREKLTALISVDLNDLKGINDQKGHAAGDKAICTVVNCMKKCLLRGCILYRVGGDEFAILCLKRKRAELEQMIQTMYTAMHETPYNCAFGLAECAEGEDFEALCARADEDMYRVKGKRDKAQAPPSS